jgi:hypothetical protein
MVGNPRFKICFVLDKTSMFRIISETTSDYAAAAAAAAAAASASASASASAGAVVEVKHSVKPLQLIWSKFPEGWSAK